MPGGFGGGPCPHLPDSHCSCGYGGGEIVGGEKGGESEPLGDLKENANVGQTLP